MNENRSAISPPENSPRNKWLLDQAAAMTMDLLVADWFERFGADAYLALRKLGEPLVHQFLTTVTEQLKTQECWPSRVRQQVAPQHPKPVKASAIIVPITPNFDGFLGNQRYLDQRLSVNADICAMVQNCGARLFGMKTLIHLRCAGKDDKSLQTKLEKDKNKDRDENEAGFHYSDFPDGLKNLDLQLRFAHALDAEVRRLTDANRTDLCDTPTTLTAAGTLAPCNSLQIVDPTTMEVCPELLENRLHPMLANTKVLSSLAKPFNMTAFCSVLRNC